MFRRAIITDEVSQDPADAVRLARRFGLDGIEIRSAWERRPDKLSEDQVRTLRGLARDGDMAVCSVATPVFKCSLDDRNAVSEHMEILKRCLGLCCELEAPIARVFTFWKPGAAGAPGGAGRERPWGEVISPIADHLTKAADIAARFSRRLGIENEPSVNGSTCEKVASLLARVNHPALGAVWDPANALYDPQSERPYPEGYQALRGHILHVHVKDALRDPQTNVTAAVALGDGDVPYGDIFRQLRHDRYRGFLSLETHYRVTRTLSEETARLPGGSAFSAGGLDASIVCLERWDEMMATPEGGIRRG